MREAPFWSGIIGAVLGAVVGGLIAYAIQVKALREGRRQRDEDRARLREALGNSLIIKMLRIHSNFHHFHRYIEEFFEKAARSGAEGEPWQIVVPLANPPDRVHFSSEELSMLLTLGDADVSNLVIQMDEVHNGLNDAIRVLGAERSALTAQLTAVQAKGVAFTSVLTKEQAVALRPYMQNVNSLIESIRVDAKKGFEESDDALRRLHQLLRDKLGISYKLERKETPSDPSG